MKSIKYSVVTFLMAILMGCSVQQNKLSVEIYETSESGNKLKKLTEFQSVNEAESIQLLPVNKYQTIIGFGGAFTESSAYLLNQMSEENRNEIMEAYFGTDGARYSFTRTHINSCDFSLSNYSYAPLEGDKDLKSFSIDEDLDDIIPMIKEAMAISEDGFKILASPWTAPPWMKDNKEWKGGKLLPEYYDSWALFFSKYLTEYKKEGIDIWGVTVENEPLGNGSNWESMHYTAEETVDFVNNHLGPKLETEGHDVKIFGYDQNRGKELEEWAEVLFKNEESSKYFYGTAVHWYSNTVDWMPGSLNFTHEIAPGKHLIHSEACIDSEVPHWKDDAWYWQKEATDWGWDWADRKDHPKYVPVYRYARDIIGCLNSWVEGWIDWNMVLDKQGGPNWANNWCNAPIIVDPENDEVYYTPMYYTLAHFSKYIRPGAIRIGFECSDKELMVTATQNPDGSFAVVILNMSSEPKNFKLSMGEAYVDVQISAQAIQTIVISS